MSTRTLSGMLLNTFEELLSVVVLNGVGERVTWRGSISSPFHLTHA